MAKWPKEWDFREGVEWGVAIVVGVSVAFFVVVVALNIYIWLTGP